jgi:hypothetical protein
MRRLNVLAEGRTEEGFVRQVLAPHLVAHGVVATARSVVTRRDRRRPDHVYRGGLGSFARALEDLDRWMKEDAAASFTTMFDLYALPADFPDHAAAARIADPYARVKHLEQALANTVIHRAFVPYIQLHEFEALLLADASKLDWHYIEHESAIERLVALSQQKDPELINDGEHTAPSKRIIAEIPKYRFEKATVGPLVAGKIGIATMRARCPHFAEWVSRLEALEQE